MDVSSHELLLGKAKENQRKKGCVTVSLRPVGSEWIPAGADLLVVHSTGSRDDSCP